MIKVNELIGKALITDTINRINLENTKVYGKRYLLEFINEKNYLISVKQDILIFMI